MLPYLQGKHTPNAETTVLGPVGNPRPKWPMVKNLVLNGAL